MITLNSVSVAKKNLPVPNQSVDLVVAGASAHWFNLDQFFREVRRVLKPTGCLAVFGYWIPRLDSFLNRGKNHLSKIATGIFEEAIIDSVRDYPVKKQVYLQLRSKYLEIFEAMPFRVKQQVHDIYAEKDCSVRDVIGYMRSSDSYGPYMEGVVDHMVKDNEEITQEALEAKDYVVQYIKDLKRIFNLPDIPDWKELLKMDFNFFLILAKP